jgi:ligand-binding sensor domain-containing protein/signal transduction histidine kinase
MKNYYLAFICQAATLFSCTNSNQQIISTNNQDTLVFAPVITRIIDLPDSLQPKIVDLSKMPEPFKIVFPEPGSSPRKHSYPDGQVVEIEPLKRKLLPAFEGKEEYIRKLKENNIFDTGKGGLPYYSAFTTDDGLAMNYVTCAAVDKSGHIWFGTWGEGISRFDGKHFTNFSDVWAPVGGLISSILVDKTGNIWIASQGGGVSCYDGTKFISYLYDQGASAARVRRIAEGQSGKIWIITEAGIRFYDPGSDSIYNLNTTELGLDSYTFNCLKAHKTGNIWFGTNKGAVCFNPVNNQITDSLTESSGLASNYIYCIHEDKEGNLWFGTNNGISCYDAVNKVKPKNYSTKDGLISNVVRNIVEDSKGNLWFGTTQGAVSCFEKNMPKARFNSFYLPFESYALLTTDSLDKLWFGTSNLGAICMDQPVSGGSGSFITFSELQGLPSNTASTVYEDSKGNLWIGTSDIVRFDGTHFTYYGASNIYPRFFNEDFSGKLWFGIYSPAAYYLEQLADGTGMRLSVLTNEHGIARNLVASLVDHNGNIWLSSWDYGIIRYDGKFLTQYNNNHGLGNNMIRSIAQDKLGNIWFGTAGRGLSCINPSNGGIVRTFNVEQGLVHNYINRLLTDSQGNLWIATNMGINVLGINELKMLNDSMHVWSDTDKRIRNLFKTFTTGNGLPMNKILNFVELRKGKIALGSSNGLAILCYPVDSMETFKSLQSMEVYNIETGYPVRGVLRDASSMFVDSKGILWIAVNSEKAPLIRFDYNALHRNDKAPTLTIRQLKLNEENIAFQTLTNYNTVNISGTTLDIPTYITDEILTYGKSMSESERQSLRKKYKRLRFDGIRKFYPIPENLVIPHKHNRVTIGFGSNELIRPQLVEYQYMLEGYDKEWSPVVKKTEASFGNINEGTYTFKVKARYTGPGINEANYWTEPVSYMFRVLPPWHRSWLADIVYSIIIITGFWRFYLIYKQRLLRLEREKAQKREIEHAHEIETAYHNLEVAHENLKSTQTQLIASEKLASLGALTAGIAHEIQNPLNFVNNFSDVNKELLEELKEELEEGSRQLAAGSRQSVEDKIKSAEDIANDLIGNEQKINHHGKRAESIVKGMLLHSRGSSGHKEPTDINALADEYLRLSYHGFRAKDKSFNADYKTDFDPNLPKINVVPQDIGRVLLNLINNAFYAVQVKTHGGASLQQTPSPHKPTVTVSTQKNSHGIEISVKDNGPGIPDNIKDKIFQPFFTTKPTGQGTGLGLSLAYDIVKAHGGEIRIESKEGEGSAFLIQLPYS